MKKAGTEVPAFFRRFCAPDSAHGGAGLNDPGTATAAFAVAAEYVLLWVLV